MSDTAKLGIKKPHTLDEARGNQIAKAIYMWFRSSISIIREGAGWLPEKVNDEPLSEV